MKLKFKNQEDENKFKEFVCKHKDVLQTFLSFGQLASGAIVRIIFKAVSEIIKVACPK